MSKDDDYDIAKAMAVNSSDLQIFLWDALSMRLFLKKKGLLDEYIDDKEIAEETGKLFDKAFKEIEKEEGEEE
jgi:hypothetical protein